MIDVSIEQRIPRPTHSCENNEHTLPSNTKQFEQEEEIKSEGEHNSLLKRDEQENVESTQYVNQNATKESEIGEEDNDLDEPLLLEGQIELIEKLVHFTAAQSIPQSEQDAIERRKRRERKAEQINARRSYSHAHRSLVEELCHTTLERRSKAAQHIAQDPPADRLIGHNVLQYIPVALLPPELRRKRVPLRTMRKSKNSSNSSNNNNYYNNDEKLKEWEEEEYITLNEQKIQPEWITKERRQRTTHPMYIGKDAVPIVFLTELEHRCEQLHEQHVEENNQKREMTNDSNNINNSNVTLHTISNNFDQRKSVPLRNVSSRYNKENSVSTIAKKVPLEKEKITINELESRKQKVARQRRLCHSKLTNPHFIKTCESTKITKENKHEVNSEECLTRRRLIGNDDSYQRRVYARTSSRNPSE